MITVDLLHRGKTTIHSIDLFDETEFGADRLRVRGTFATLWECAYQMAFALADTEALNKIKEEHPEDITLDFSEINFEDYNCGNPMAVDATHGIALNRYNVPEKKHWENSIYSGQYPNHADYCVQFILRCQFYKDYGYIHLGLPWSDNESGPILLEQLKVVKCCNVSPEDAEVILKEIVGEQPQPHDVWFAEGSMTLNDWLKEDGIYRAKLIDEKTGEQLGSDLVVTISKHTVGEYVDALNDAFGEWMTFSYDPAQGKIAMAVVNDEEYERERGFDLMIDCSLNGDPSMGCVPDIDPSTGKWMHEPQPQPSPVPPGPVVDDWMAVGKIRINEYQEGYPMNCDLLHNDNQMGGFSYGNPLVKKNYNAEGFVTGTVDPNYNPDKPKNFNTVYGEWLRFSYDDPNGNIINVEVVNPEYKNEIGLGFYMKTEMCMSLLNKLNQQGSPNDWLYNPNENE